MKVFIKTYGCQMNEYDSNFIRKIMSKMMLDEVDSYQEADLVIINTCTIREKASEKLYSELGRINAFKQRKLMHEGKYTVIAVIGCVAQSDGEIIFKRAPFVDIVIGPQGYHKFEELFYNAMTKKNKQISLDFEANDKFDYIAEELASKKDISASPSEFVTIQEGCDRFCTFCVVPYTRGPEVSRSVQNILDEVTRLRDKGAKEIFLLGQNVNSYHGTDKKGSTWNLAQLISEIALIDGIERIRYTTSHPCYMDKDLIAVHGSEEKLMPMLNLPVQSGSNKILELMNRRHKREDYINIIKLLRKVRPDIQISSDFIVGFPEETEQDFLDTLDLVKTIVFEAQSFAFKYSIRVGTPAASMTQVPEEAKTERLKALQDLLEEQRFASSQRLLHSTVKVLFNKEKMRYENQLGGRTEFGNIVIASNLSKNKINELKGNVCNAKITEIRSNSLECIPQ